MLIRLGVDWKIGDRIGGGGFGNVYSAVSPDGVRAAAKLVPKAPGAERELLFVELGGVPNVVPIIDRGETDDHWVMVMPLAEASLRQRLDRAADPLPTGEAVAILTDLATALSALDGRVVHRDLKPENALLLEGRWCLADFGISRYAEATTAPDTRKFALSAPYAAPERWRQERATTATDVYSFGVVAFELLTGSRPFAGPAAHDYREQHLHQDPPEAGGGSAALKALVAECLFKAPGVRPSPAAIVARLGRIERTAASPGLARLQDANLAEVARMGEAAAQASKQRSEEGRRRDLAAAATQGLTRIGDQLRTSISDAAPAAQVRVGRAGGWSVHLGGATLSLKPSEATPPKPWEPWYAPAFDVVAHASLVDSFPTDRYGYGGRGHSLWFCDAREAGRFGWFETAFMLSPLSRQRSAINPFALPPGEEAAKALWTGLAEFDVAWPFEPLTFDDLDGFVGRWAGWLAQAGQGRLSHPNTMPERQAGGTWRRG